jgi:GTP diphosphokinase / guanosine-3',5'-bis(diphosphate) 3'-diphosphatase
MINEAMHFAIVAHGKQKRKGTGTLYVFHPFEVGYILSQEGLNEEVICAGILHDTMEDAKVSYDTLKQVFSEKVADLVKSQSEDKSLTWQERKQHTLDEFRNKRTIEECLICCADKLSNIRSTEKDYHKVGEKLWDRFNKGHDLQKWYYIGLVESLNRLEKYDMYKEFREKVETVFGKAKSNI